ncbi:hypothetical protein DSLASN_18750 [Desulfoluna limicola]|uniref:Uncharacterized protein n=1 Tax=Desulfoluna limicola TaxID=2810562 RepID=A0ABM7PGB7_9BACT|nr:hypothetical protein DSLASN_18750 [Desulfoluna limicola]
MCTPFTLKYAYQTRDTLFTQIDFQCQVTIKLNFCFLLSQFEKALKLRVNLNLFTHSRHKEHPLK